MAADDAAQSAIVELRRLANIASVCTPWQRCALRRRRLAGRPLTRQHARRDLAAAGLSK